MAESSIFAKYTINQSNSFCSVVKHRWFVYTVENLNNLYNTFQDNTSPDGSPAPSPGPVSKDKPFDFSSPPDSPRQCRPRSATIGAIPDMQTLGSLVSKHEEKHREEKRELEKRRASESPMKHMYVKITFCKNSIWILVFLISKTFS